MYVFLANTIHKKQFSLFDALVFNWRRQLSNLAEKAPHTVAISEWLEEVSWWDRGPDRKRYELKCEDYENRENLLINASQINWYLILHGVRTRTLRKWKSKLMDRPQSTLIFIALPFHKVFFASFFSYQCFDQ